MGTKIKSVSIATIARRVRLNSATAIYVIHAIVVGLTAYLLSVSDLASWYLALLIGVPLLLALAPSLSGLSYTLNARILFPISIGLLTVSLFHYFPEILSTNSDQLSLYGVSNDDRLDQDFFVVNPIFKDSVSVLYALCAAFLLLKGLNDFDELKNVLYEEANELRSISDFSSYFIASGAPEENAPIIHRIQENLLSYIENMMAGNKVVANETNEMVLEECILKVGHLNAVDENDKIALAEIMKSLNRISVLRTRRTVCIEKRMSPYILGLMLIMSLTMVGSFFGKATGELSIDYVYVFLLTGFYSSIFMTLIDLSSPFDGYWTIKLGAVYSTEKKLRKQLGSEKSTELGWHPADRQDRLVAASRESTITHPSSTPR